MKTDRWTILDDKATPTYKGIQSIKPYPASIIKRYLINSSRLASGMIRAITMLTRVTATYPHNTNIHNRISFCPDLRGTMLYVVQLSMCFITVTVKSARQVSCYYYGSVHQPT